MAVCSCLVQGCILQMGVFCSVLVSEDPSIDDSIPSISRKWILSINGEPDVYAFSEWCSDSLSSFKVLPL